VPYEFPDTNGDGRIDSGELAMFLKRQTQSGLMMVHGPGTPPPPFNPIGFSPGHPVNPAQSFKMAVERHWQNAGNTNTSATGTP
jgi:hypothetical protein